MTASNTVESSHARQRSDEFSSVTSKGAAIDLIGIEKSYGPVKVVDDVSLAIKPGEFITLLGPSGSGKTTLLRIIAGLISLDTGKVMVNGRDISKVLVHRREMGLVFQNYALFPHMTVQKNVGFPLAMKRVPREERDARIAEALRAVQLTGFSHRRPKELSGGQQQRVALARAIVSRPRVLLLDEPLGSLDRRLRESLQVEISTLSRELSLTVINVTHDQEEALIMSDRIALLQDARVVQFGTPEELYSHPATRAVAEFLGDANIFRGRVQLTGEALQFVSDDGHIVAPPMAGGGASWGESVLVVRPSVIRLETRPPLIDKSRTSVVKGSIEAIYFTGEARRFRIRTRAGTEMRVQASIHEYATIRPGDEVYATWEASASVVTPTH